MISNTLQKRSNCHKALANLLMNRLRDHEVKVKLDDYEETRNEAIFTYEMTSYNYFIARFTKSIFTTVSLETSLTNDEILNGQFIKTKYKTLGDPSISFYLIVSINKNKFDEFENILTLYTMRGLI